MRVLVTFKVYRMRFYWSKKIDEWTYIYVKFAKFNAPKYEMPKIVWFEMCGISNSIYALLYKGLPMSKNLSVTRLL